MTVGMSLPYNINLWHAWHSKCNMTIY